MRNTDAWMGRSALALALMMGCAETGSNTRDVTTAHDAASADSEAPWIGDVASEAVETEVARLERETSARRVAVVVLRVEDGLVLAHHDARDPVPTGSTLKPLTIAAALEAGLDPELRFDTPSPFRDGDVELTDWSPRPSLDAREVLVHSSNVGTARIAQRVGPHRVHEMLTRFGFDRPCNVGEDGHFPPADEWVGGPGLRLAAGIDITASPFHIAAAYLALARGGMYAHPTTMGDHHETRVMSEATARRVVAMLEAATSEGTGQRARIDGQRVAGKTGTAVVADPEGDRHFASYVGIVDAEAPRFVIYVGVDVDASEAGGTVAAPAFARIAQAL
ncbi:MAG: penicillin-binding transpeptidase domain-containing protein [Sandaracinaceae bacterium]